MSYDYFKKYQNYLDPKLEKYFAMVHDSIQPVIKTRVSKPVSPAKNKNFLVWDFDLRSSKWDGAKSRKGAPLPGFDFYLLIGLNDDIPEKVFLLPAYGLDVTHVRIPIAGKSKYYQYVI